MKTAIVVVGVAVVAFVVFKSVQKQAAKSKLEAVGKALSGSTMVDARTGLTESWTPYGPKAGS